ncbi:MAG: AAA family ATPase [Saprospiraceae bacterium]|nr:AAA family ATPase [Candidatus Opimibacter iunctus]
MLSYLFKNGLEKHSGGSDFGQKPFVLIIDEINRGNVSQIFGELITLIEQDKRKGASESIQIILPYSKEAFSVPKSLYIIGTMNTADRSVEALDTALRRRFTFEEMPPRYDLKELNRMAGNHLLKDILQRINIRLEKLLDKDHMIGHSYFMFPQDNDTISALMESFYKNIIPLLQEYFFGDYGKIGLVLGNGFVNIKDQKEKIFCAFDYDGADMLLEKPVYTIVDYRKPSSNLTDGMTFSLAIDTLMDNRI